MAALKWAALRIAWLLIKLAKALEAAGRRLTEWGAR